MTMVDTLTESHGMIEAEERSREEQRKELPACGDA